MIGEIEKLVFAAFLFVVVEGVVVVEVVVVAAIA